MRLLALSFCCLVVGLEAITNGTATVRRRLKKEPPRDCSDAPDINIKKSCLMYHSMDKMARKRLARQAQRNQVGEKVTLAVIVTVTKTGSELDSFQVVNQPGGPPNWLTPIPVPANARGQYAYHPYDCMTIACICPFFNVRLQFKFLGKYRRLGSDARSQLYPPQRCSSGHGLPERI